MNILNQTNPRTIRQAAARVSYRPLPAVKLVWAIALLALAGGLAASAADVTLKTSDAPGTSSFTGSTNWSSGNPPTAGNAYFTAANTIRTTNYNVNAGSVALTFGGDSLSIDSGGRMIGKIGNNGSAGKASTAILTANYILNGGLLDQASGSSGNDVLIIAGTVTVNAASFLGAIGGTSDNNANFCTLEIAAPISGSADLQVSGQNVNGGADTGTVKLSAANPYSGTITVPSSRTSNAAIASAVNRMLQLNNLDAVSNATLNLTTVNLNPVSFAAAVNAAPFNLAALTGTSSQTLSDTVGSPVTLSVGGNNASSTYAGALTDGGNLVKVGSGSLTLTGTNTYYGATTVSGGSLQLGNGGDGGSLTGGGSLTVNANLTVNRDNAVVQGVDFTASPITGTGSFTQAGTGTTILNAANSYSGATTVSAGELVISSAQTGTGAITVADGAVLGITVSGTSQLPPGTLTLGTSAATALDFDGVNSTTIAPINAGTVAVGGTVTVNINTGTFAAGNRYPLIHWTTGGPADASSFALGLSPGLTANLSVSGSTLYLNVSGVSDIWTGAVSGNWDMATANWTGHATVFANGDSVLFDDSTYNDTVTVSAAVQPGNVVFNNSDANPYTITSSGADNIGGSGGLTKNNTGSVTLSGGANTYTGATVINGGGLSVGVLANGGSASDLGAATSASTNLVLDGGTLQYTGATVGTDRGATLGAGGATVDITSGGVALTSSGVVAGPGSLTKTGVGALVLSGANTFSGGVTVSAGELDLNNGGASSDNSAIGTGTLTISANTTIDNTSGSDVTLLPNNAQVWNGSFTYGGLGNSLNLGTGPVSLPASSTVTINGNTLTVGGAISGAGGLTVTGSGTLVLASANTFAGGIDLQAGTLVIGSDLAVGTGRLNFDDGGAGVTFQSLDGTAHTITNAINFGGTAGATTIFSGTGNLKFTASAANGTSKTLVVDNPQTEFSGVLSGASARTVAGTGTLILSGANTYTAGTTVNPGATLQLGNGGTNGSLSTSGVIDNEGTLTFDRSDALVQGINFASAPITGAGSVVQAGSGTTTLNVANSYTGPTTVNNGELIITPADQAGGNVSVADAASFGVLASSVSNSATIGNLTLGGGGATTLDFSFGLTGNPTNAALSAGAVTINGTCTIRIGGTFVAGTFPVLKYSSLSGAFASTVVGPRGVAATLFNDTVNQVIDVTVTSVGHGIVWTGTNSVLPNLWDLNTTTNWLIGGLPTTYFENVPPGDAVTFDDQGSGEVLLSNTVSPASVTISNASLAYTFDGTGQINSLGGLTKVGAATVTMNVPGTFSGSTILSNGTFNLGADQTLANLSGDSAVTVAAGTPTLTVNDSLDTAFSGDVSGALTLVKDGAGDLTLTGSNSFSGNLFVSLGTVTLDSGSISSGTYCSIGHGDTDIGTLTLKGTANFATTSDLNAGDVGSSVGTINIQDNADVTVNAFYVGSANATGSTASGTVYQTGGTVTVSTANFAIGGRNQTTSLGGTGAYYLSGGTVNASGGIRLGAGGVGTLTQTGGTIDCNGDVNIARYTGATGTYNFDGGTLQANSVTSSTSANATFNFNGGVLMPRAASTTFVRQLSQANVRNGGVIVDTTNFNVTIPQTLQHSTLAGDNAIDGGLTKRGAGTLTLTEAGSYYTGPTVVTGGALNLSPGSLSSLNNVTVANAALGLSMNGGTASYSATSLTLENNSALNLNYDVVSGTPIVGITVSGSLAASGTTTINVFGYGFTVGQFPLISYTGTPLANLNNFRLGALPYGVTATLSNDVANLSLDLVITSVSSLNWIPLANSDAVGSSSFSSGGNWLDGNPPTAGNGYFTRAFTLRSPADKNAYTFGGDILAVDAGGQVLFKGTGGQAITVGNLLVNGGLVVFGVSTSDNYTETLAGAVTLQTGTTSTLAANGSTGAAETLSVTAPISGSGNLQINGISGDLGTILLAGTNTYSGATTVAGGTLLVNGAGGNSPIIVSASATLGGTGSVGGAIAVQAGGTLAPGIPSRGALTAALGTLTAGTATVNGTVQMKLDRDATPASDELVAPGVVVNSGATLTVNNLGSTNLAAGDTFTLFSTPVSGAFATVNLPPLPSPGLYWTNRLAIDGTIAVASATISPATLVSSFNGTTLALSWPAGQGWELQWQTNGLDSGLGTNWVTVPGSSSLSSTNITVDPAMPAVFYRLMQ